MRPRTTAAAIAALVAFGTAGCTSGDGNVAEIPDPGDPTPDTTPFIEPVSPPAEDLDRPDEETETAAP